MSSHREAPEISKDPSADNTDVYAFVDPISPSKVNLIANFNPFELPYGGPNFSEFADDVLYTINVSNRGTAHADISYNFRFTTIIRNPDTFLYNVGPITGIADKNWNRPQYYQVEKVERSGNGRERSTTLGRGLLVPPCNVGDRSTPSYAKTFESAAVHSLGEGRRVFAGQRSDAFFVDLGSVFDLAGLRPLNEAHEIPLTAMDGMNGLQGLNVHTIALQVPITELAKGGKRPADPASPHSVVGVWASTHRSRGRFFDSERHCYRGYGGDVQVSRLGNPLVNEVINPMSVKDKWNGRQPNGDAEFAKYVDHPELAGLLPVLYPGAFPRLAAFNRSKKPRADLDAILLTGIPAAVLGGKLTTYTGPTKADMLRLNLAVPPTRPGKENNLGVVAGDNAGFPNGRRVVDDVTTIELRAVAGLTIPLVDPSYQVDDILKGDALRDGTHNSNLPLLDHFPYLATPASGYGTKPPVPAAS